MVSTPLAMSLSVMMVIDNPGNARRVLCVDPGTEARFIKRVYCDPSWYVSCAGPAQTEKRSAVPGPCLTEARFREDATPPKAHRSIRRDRRAADTLCHESPPNGSRFQGNHAGCGLLRRPGNFLCTVSQVIVPIYFSMDGNPFIVCSPECLDRILEERVRRTRE